MAEVLDGMMTRPTTHPVDATIGDARAFFADSHKHLMLLVDDGRLRGTLVRRDLPTSAADDLPALSVAVLRGRTVAPDADLERVRGDLVQRERRRLAVVDDTGRLLGLLCLKKHQRGFCSDEDVDERAVEHAGKPLAGRDQDFGGSVPA